MDGCRTRARPGQAAARLAGLMALLLLGGAAACGDDDPTDLDLIDRDLVVGTYDPTTLTFDVAGPTFGEYDLLEGLRTDEVPPLLVISSDGSAQLVFLDPATGRFEQGEGTYALQEAGIRVTFENATAPGRLLLPRTLELAYDAQLDRLEFSEDVNARLDRLVDLVPELEDEPLSDPVTGFLTATFTPR